MELVKVWSQLSLMLGLTIYWTNATPLDMESAQMAVMTGINVAMDAADKINGDIGTSNELAFAGVELKHSLHGSVGDVGVSDDRRRRRRFADENVALAFPLEHRNKRSPCRARTTAAPEADENIETGAKIKEEGTARSGGNSRTGRRKRSPDQNDVEGDDQFVLDENSKQFTQAIQQMVNNTLNMMSGVIKKIQKNLMPPEQFN